MKRCFLLSALALILALALPLLLPMAAPDSIRERLFPPSPAPVFRPQEEAVPGTPDGRTRVSLLAGDEVRLLTMEEYLPGVLAGEMPVSFQPEALRAQAVAARTFAAYHAGHAAPRHPEAEVCSDSGCCQVWLGEAELRDRWGADYEANMGRIRSAVESTDGQILTYGGEPILSCFHASSAGATENSAVLWGRALPYLVSVDSPETASDVPGFVSTVEVWPEEFREVILSAYPDAGLTDTIPPDWLGSRTLDTSGRVAAIRVGGQAVPGTAMRSLFSLRSAHFTLEWTGHSFLFTVTGSGHGAGMSQYGANVMAREGADFAAILAHYYPGTELSPPAV